MNVHSTGCIVCGKPLVYTRETQKLPCSVCGREFETSVSCEGGHYVCDACHAQKGLDAVTVCALSATSKNPAEIAVQMMELPSVNMHGPEHHYLIVAALLSAYQNAGGNIVLENALKTALGRAKQVPGGICGLWGNCGAAVGTGIFFSIITGANPLTEENWSAANTMTSKGLAAIAGRGGPRCCKRDVWTAIEEAVRFTGEELGVSMESASGLQCAFFPKNKECKKETCPYYPASSLRNQ